MDTSFIHADIFFYVTTIAVVVVGAAFTIVLIILAKILVDIKEITGHVKDEAILVREDIGNLRNDIRREGFRIERLWSFVSSLIKGKKTKTTSSRSK